MKEYDLKNYSYQCRCGYEMKVSTDFGLPQEHFKCRTCGTVVKRGDQ